AFPGAFGLCSHRQGTPEPHAGAAPANMVTGRHNTLRSLHFWDTFSPYVHVAQADTEDRRRIERGAVPGGSRRGLASTAGAPTGRSATDGGRTAGSRGAVPNPAA